MIKHTYASPSVTSTTGHHALGRLLPAAMAGDQRAWEDLVSHFEGMIRAIARSHRLGEADVADVVQTTWLRLVQHIHGLRDPASIGAWLATTARRECLHVLRARGRELPAGEDLPEPPAPEPDHDHALLRHERDQALHRAFTRLPGRDQTLLRTLTAEPRPSYAATSRALHMPVGSIGPTRARALDRLREKLEDNQELELMLAA